MVSVVILAAGFGTRMHSQTPKVLHAICGKSMLSYAIDTALQISSDIHVVLYNQAERIAMYLQEHYMPCIADKITLHTQHHDIYPGTGGALMQKDKSLLPIKNEKIIIISGDTPLMLLDDLQKLAGGNAPINLAIFETKMPQGYGRILQKAQLNKKTYTISGIVEEKDCTKEQKAISLVNAGAYCFNREILESYIPRLDNKNAQNEYYLTDIVALATKDSHEIYAHVCPEENMFGVNTKLHLAQAEQIMLARLRNKAMQKGVIMQIPDSIYIDYDVCFEGECVLENGVRITGKSHIKESHIKAHSVIEQSIITQSDIGPHAHIRPNSNIKDSHIGNFVECKNANLIGVKAGHLSYLGDCDIDEGTNIGAGVITCNYDGKKKHKTIVGKNVFVGSDCQLVAPLNIASHVLIGAGSTITKDIQEGELALSRTKQTNYPNGFSRFFMPEE